MDDPKTPEQVFGERLGAIRRRREGWTQAYLAERVSDFGETIDRGTIAKIETGRRGVSLNEALVLSAALGVSPIFLFFPTDPHEKVAIGDSVRAPAGAARKWVQGYRPLKMDDDLKMWEAEVVSDLTPWASATQFLTGMIEDLNQYLVPLEVGELDEAGRDELGALVVTMKGVLDQQVRAAKRFADQNEAGQ